MPQIDSLVRSLVWQTLTDSTTGFNQCVDNVITTYDGGLDANLVKNDGWDLGRTACFGLMSPDALEESSLINYPFVCVDITSSTPGTGSSRWVMSATFAGTIQFTVQMHISWPESATLPNFSVYGDLAQDAMHACLNNPQLQMVGPGLAYGGRLALFRGPVAMGGLNWRQTLTFQGTFAAVVD